jgi:hypothetical protein
MVAVDVAEVEASASLRKAGKREVRPFLDAIESHRQPEPSARLIADVDPVQPLERIDRNVGGSGSARKCVKEPRRAEAVCDSDLQA